MKNFYEVGRVYVWQNQVGDLECYNGMECTVTGPEVEFVAHPDNKVMAGWPTDTPLMPWHRGVSTCLYAVPGDLRPKNPPPGEQSVLDMFNLNDLVDA
jgi:hypothetical protein